MCACFHTIRHDKILERFLCPMVHARFESARAISAPVVSISAAADAAQMQCVIFFTNGECSASLSERTQMLLLDIPFITFFCFHKGPVRVFVDRKHELIWT